MFADRILITDVRKASQKRSLSNREYIDRRISEYINACDLSRGGDKQRSAYWEMEAQSIKRELSAIAGRKIREEVLR